MKVLIHEWVTGGGLAGTALPASWAAEGRAMRRAVADDFRSLAGVEVITTLDERFAGDEPSAAFERIGPGQEEDVLARLTSRCDYTVLIAPETGGILESRTRLIRAAGGRSLGSTPGAIALTADKRRMARHLEQQGMRTPRTEAFASTSGPPPDFPYPAVVKPADGAGAMHTYQCGRREDVPSGPDLPLEMVIQPICPGTPMSATFLLGPSGSVDLVGVGWQRIEVRRGRLEYCGGRVPAPSAFALGEPLAAVRSVKGLRGIVGVDFVREDGIGTTTVIEINPRLTTSFVGLCRLLPPGAIARAWLDVFAGRASGRDLRAMIENGAGDGVTFSTEGRDTPGQRGG
jgi:predicted ATP-grasp superfamily ATP-dependent carboligase